MFTSTQCFFLAQKKSENVDLININLYDINNGEVQTVNSWVKYVFSYVKHFV